MSAFTPIGHSGPESENSDSFWPSFTDIMMVVVLIFLMATSLLIVRNWHLVAELQESIEAEQLAEQMIESTSLENATLEERLTNAEQLNSILRLRLLDRDEKLKRAAREAQTQQQIIAALETDKSNLNTEVTQKIQELDEAQLKIGNLNTQSEQLNKQIAELKQQHSKQLAELQEQQKQQIAELQQQLQDQIQLAEATQIELEMTTAEIAVLSASSEKQQQDIALLEQEKIEYNRQLLSLQGDYEVVKSKYEQLIKPARSAKGKYIVEVYYVKQQDGEVIKYREPGDSSYTTHSLTTVEQKLSKLKQEKGADLYVKIIIPENSGLSYNEAWDFMKALLKKYDYYYQSDDANL